MRDYTQYTADDFIADEQFQRWVKSPDNHSNDWWEKWRAAHPEKNKEIIRAMNFIHGLRFTEDLPDNDHVEDRLAQSLGNIAVADELSTNRQRKKTRVKKAFRWTAVVLITGCLAIAAWQYLSDPPVMVRTVTRHGEVKTLLLPDSSVVTLNANSGVSYSSGMRNAERREVWLEGEAFFNVKHSINKNQDRRFIVHSRDLNIEVTGTSFNVKSLANVTNISLNTGKIRVALNSDPGTTVNLQPGDFLQYSSKEKQMIKKQVRPELYSVWKEQMMVLDKIPFSDIAHLIEDAYGYKVKIADRKMDAEKISGTLRMKDEAGLFAALAYVLDVSIVKRDSVIVFTKNRN